MREKELIEFELVNLTELTPSEVKSLRELAVVEDFQVVENPELDDPTRSLAFVKFVLCRSLPAVNRNGACWTYATLRNSLSTVAHQVIDLNHHLEQNSDLLKKKVRNEVVGHMISADIAPSPDDLLIPTSPISMMVTGVINKRLAPALVERLKNGERVKVSMECEYEDFGFWWDGRLYESKENEELWNAFKTGERQLNGKPFARVLGGIAPEGGVVNFWGAAMLIGEPPADPAAEVKAALATENPDDNKEKNMENENVVVTPEQEAAKVDETVTPEVASSEAHLVPPTMVTDDLEKLNHKDLSVAEQLNALVKQEVEKALAAKLEEMAQRDANPVKDMINAQNPDIDPNAVYADPGYNEDRTPKFSLEKAEGVLEAAAYFVIEANRDNYTPTQCALIDKRISNAAAKFGLTESDLKTFTNVPASNTVQPETATEATEANTREESTMNNEENKKVSTEAASEASAELAATKKAIIDKLSVENAALKEQMNDMAKKLDDMKKDQEVRMKKDRASARKTQLASKLGDIDEKLETAIAGLLTDSDDDEFESFRAIAEFIFDRGFTAGTQKHPSQSEIEGSQGEPTPYTRKVNVQQHEQTPAMLPKPAGNPDTLKGSDTASVTPYAPVVNSEVASEAKAKKNRFAGM